MPVVDPRTQDITKVPQGHCVLLLTFVFALRDTALEIQNIIVSSPATQLVIIPGIFCPCVALLVQRMLPYIHLKVTWHATHIFLDPRGEVGFLMCRALL